MFLLRNKKGNHVEDSSKVFAEALAGGETLDSAFRTAARLVAKEAVERFMESEMAAYLGYSKYDRRNRRRPAGSFWDRSPRGASVGSRRSSPTESPGSTAP